MEMHYDDLIERLRNATKLPMIQALANEAADAIQELLAISNHPISFSTSIYNEEEIHNNCTVQIWRNTITGDVSIGWWENSEVEE